MIDDFHCHLRQTALCNVVTKRYDAECCLVMPNTLPPILTTDGALAYNAYLISLNKHTRFYQTLYLSPSLTPDEVIKAAQSSHIIKAVKSYPKGCDAGITVLNDTSKDLNLILCIHGEVPSNPEGGICILNAEESFLHHLEELHFNFPRLKIVLEHASTRAAVELVKRLGDTVACTITIHHLELTIDDWAGCCHCYCKPVAKYPHDRQALRDIVKQGHPRFFLGTDSAPHPKSDKEGPKSAAGVYTGIYATQYLAHALESFGALDQMENFARVYGRRFYSLDPKINLITGQPRAPLVLKRSPFKIPDSIEYVDDDGQEQSLIPYKAGQMINFTPL